MTRQRLWKPHGVHDQVREGSNVNAQSVMFVEVADLEAAILARGDHDLCAGSLDLISLRLSRGQATVGVFCKCHQAPAPAAADRLGPVGGHLTEVCCYPVQDIARLLDQPSATGQVA